MWKVFKCICQRYDKPVKFILLVYAQNLYNMKREILLAVLVVAFVGGCKHKAAEVYSQSSQAISGYDPLAYFTEGRPVKGSEAFTYKWKDANWYFSSQQNLDSFKNAPEKYAPQYGGYCAYGCSFGRKVSTDPNAWTIVDGKLYLNHSAEVKAKWIKDQKERIDQADKNWPDVKDK